MPRNYKRKTDRVYKWTTPRVRVWDKNEEAKRKARLEEKRRLEAERLEASREAYEAMLAEAELETERIKAYTQIKHAT
jgi:hypothetical protein